MYLQQDWFRPPLYTGIVRWTPISSLFTTVQKPLTHFHSMPDIEPLGQRIPSEDSASRIFSSSAMNSILPMRRADAHSRMRATLLETILAACCQSCLVCVGPGTDSLTAPPHSPPSYDIGSRADRGGFKRKNQRCVELEIFFVQAHLVGRFLDLDVGVANSLRSRFPFVALQRGLSASFVGGRTNGALLTCKTHHPLYKGQTRQGPRIKHRGPCVKAPTIQRRDDSTAY